MNAKSKRLVWGGDRGEGGGEKMNEDLPSTQCRLDFRMVRTDVLIHWYM